MAKKMSKKSTKKKAAKKKVTRKRKNPGLAKAMPRSERQWEIDSALNTLIRAEEIKGDSKLMKEVEMLKKKKMNALDKV